MSLLDKASLIVTPNAYKESKLYSVVPNTTLGDMDVVRATTATRVNSAGLIEEVPRNLLTYSNTFSNAAWFKNSCTISVNSIISPDATQNGSKLVEGTANDSHHIYQNVISSGQNTFTFYAKQGERKFVYAYAESAGQGKCFDLENGTLGVNIIAAPLNSSITSVGNGWYRCSITISITATALRIGACSANGTFSYLGNGTSGIYIYGAQVDKFATATEYFPTTTRLNIPRIDYTNGSCPSLLVEPQRTNLITQSNNFSDIGWEKIFVTATLSSTDFLNGEKSYLVSETALAGVHYISKITNVSVGVTNTYSIYFKKGTGSSAPDIVRLRGFWGDAFVNFNIVTGTKLYQSASVISASITPASNGWFRCTMTYSGVSSSNNYFIVQFVNNTDSTTGNLSYVGNVNANVFVAGGQNEAGAYPTSYIPTVASTVTRNADVISKTGISSLIGQTEGTLFSDFNVTNNDLSSDKTIFSVDDNSYYVNIIAARILSNNFLNITFRANSVSVTLTNLPTITNGNHKIAIRYGNGFASIFVDGILRDTKIWTNSFTNSMSQLFIGKNRIEAPYFNDRIKSVQVYKTALSDTECINLTTL